MTARRYRLVSMISVSLSVLVGIGSVQGLDVAVPYVHGDFFHDRGYWGSDLEIGVIDLFIADPNHSAIDGNHVGYVNFSNPPTLMSDHATEVTGAAVSQNATYTGMAPGAGWWSAQTTKRNTKTTIRTQTVAAETFAQGLGDLSGNPVEVITLSIGLGGDTTGEDQWSRALDHIVDTNGRTITVAAGNDGPTPGTLSGLPTAAYNIITVGATGDTAGSVSEDYSRLAYYSARGPTTDGRCKPDIVAPGSMIAVPKLNQQWAEVSGTSLATPLVAGGAALLIDMGGDLGHSTDPRVIKSMLLNSADKLSGWMHTPTTPLDLNQGAGQMNLKTAYRQYVYGEKDPGAVTGIGWDQGEIVHGAENLYTLDPNLPVGAVVTGTLTWNRVVTTNTEDIQSAVYSVDHLDNLDLHLYDVGDPNTPLVSSVSTIDNVEHIYFSVTDPGSYAFGVEISGSAPGDAEIYSLSWSVAPGEGLDFPGDANLDGGVDVGDLGILAANYGHDDRTWFEGDFSRDGLVDVGDLGILAGNYGPGGGQLVPEPATVGLLGLCAGVLLRRRTI